eukprot:1142389-Pelagomonas_calceolata.AAC.2
MQEACEKGYLGHLWPQTAPMIFACIEDQGPIPDMPARSATKALATYAPRLPDMPTWWTHHGSYTASPAQRALALPKSRPWSWV